MAASCEQGGRGAATEPDLRAGTADKIVCRHSLYRLNASMIEQKKSAVHSIIG